MVTRMQLMNMAEEAICGQKTQEFVELVANNYQPLSTFLENDENFRASFRMSCIRLANSSSYLYHFLAALGLVGEDRPTSFATVMNLMHIVTSPKKHHRMMSGFLIKVILFIFCITTGVQAWDYKVETTAEHILINSHIDTIEYAEITEQFTLKPIFDQMARINSTLKLIQGLLEFNLQNRDCTNLGNLNSNTDDIKELISIAIKMKT